MCGIVGYIGKDEQAYSVLIDGLRALEYRGYDSAGVAVAEDGKLTVVKEKGRVADLDTIAQKKHLKGTIGIGHTRWATHGVPNQLNAHPHRSADGEIILVHNGIIENYAALREQLIKKGVTFKSETDTEVLANLIADVKATKKLSTFKAVQAALKQVRGAYAIAVLAADDLDTLVLAKKSSPLAIGIADGAFFVGSDATPIIKHTQKVIYLGDDEVAELRRDGSYEVISLNKGRVKPEIQKVEMSATELEKNGFDHFMLKEIYEQPKVIKETMRGRLSLDEQTVMLGGIADFEKRILRAPKLTIVACGTSWHAGLVGKYIIEELTRIPVEVEYASEFRYRKPPISNKDVVIAISQSGETADTLAAVQLANELGALTLGIVNVVGSSIARATRAGVYTHAGAEVSVASTKAFSTQVTVLTLLALRLARQLGTICDADLHKYYKELAQLPEWTVEALLNAKDAKTAAKYITGKPVVLYLGRGNTFPVALEGALKLKEISYVPAEAYPAGEMKHGPIALLDKGIPAVVIIPQTPELREKSISNIEEIKARGAYVIAIAPTGDKEIEQLCDIVLSVPEVPEVFYPIIASVPLQLIAYHAALHLGKDVDKPRNLAKSVTVE
jgi:glucosamine--fructose-6-phosphate aminotransferase (isomerizing)